MHFFANSFSKVFKFGNSLNIVKKINNFNKVPSAMITNTVFLEHVAKQKKKTFISTGMCQIKDIV